VTQAEVERERRKSQTDVGYANARIRAMRTRLLKDAQYEDLMASEDVRDIIESLSATEYSEDLERELLHGRTAEQVDEALKDNLVRTHKQVLDFLNPKSQQLLEALLAKWDLFNIKTILRAKHNELGMDKIRDSVMPAGSLTQVEIEALAKQEDIGAVVDTLAMWGVMYASPLRAAFGRYIETNNLSELELAADRAYAAWAEKELSGRGENKKVARDILGTQIDVLNLLSIFRLINAEVPVEDARHFYLPGGKHITQSMYGKLVGVSDVDEVINQLKATPYSPVLDEAALRYLERGSLSTFERALEMEFMRRARAAGRDIDGIGVSIAYLLMKLNEITNLRIIVKGKEVGMPPDRVREELIHV
jgi:V/A-type H+-transporting ATPase subunit C